MPGDNSSELTTVIIAVSAVFLTLVVFIIGFFLWHQKRKKQDLEKLYQANWEKQRLEEKYQQTLLQAQLEIQEQTLKNISQEIHDNIGQALTLAKLNLNTLPVSDTVFQDKILITKELVSKAIVDLRDLSRSFNTDYISEKGLERSIEYELGLVQKTGVVETHFTTKGDAFRLDKQKELILFRILQETLSNILKHAEAKNVFISLYYEPSQLTLTISDDGKGFNMDSHSSLESNGLGIRNMSDRARLIGGVLTMNSMPGQGAQIIISLPLSSDA